MLGLMFFGVASAAAGTSSNPSGFPYIPTQILTPTTCINDSACRGADIAYIFARRDAGLEFLALNYSDAVGADTELEIVTTSLPFYDDDGGTATFQTVRDLNGDVMVYAGDCEGGVGEIWTFAGEQWEMSSTNAVDEGVKPRGPHFLGGAIAYSSRLAPELDPPTMYTYGGMCSEPKSSRDDWQTEGTYNELTTSIAPTDEEYDVSVASTDGPRNGIAGFTLTPLPPSVTNISGEVTQRASYVLLGGHTQQAFINMSTAAVWNLPEQSWSYVQVLPPLEEDSSDAIGGGQELAVMRSRGNLAERQAIDNVYSRSGHTAVLTADGSAVVVLGGWVGDVNTPAEPQLAVLDVSEAYSDWRWQIPTQQPDGFGGIYGHGAAVLPGNVMMVYGGWEIGAASELIRRQSITGRPMFLNLTSMEWTSAYTNPAIADAPDVPTDGNEDGPEDGQQSIPETSSDDDDDLRLPLGLGLGLGLGLLLCLIIGLCWRRRTNKRKAAREEVVRSLAQDATCFLNDDGGEMSERDGFFSWGGGGWYTGGRDRYQAGDRSLGYESLRGARKTGFGAGGAPLGSGVLKKSAPRHHRGGYVPAGSFGSGPQQSRIHPILEDDEEESSYQQHDMPAAHTHEPHTPGSDNLADPFLTPTGASPTALAGPVLDSYHMPAPPSPTRASDTSSPELERRRLDPEVQDWNTDVNAAEGMLARMGSRSKTQQGRLSPTRRNSQRSVAFRDDDSRTGSGVSESNRSAAAESLRQSPVTRKMNAFFGGSWDARPPGSSSGSSYNTARSQFGTLQAEGPSLLTGTTNPTGVQDEDDMILPGSPSKSKPRRGWLGSLRRVFSTSGTTTPSDLSSSAASWRTDSPDHRGDYDTAATSSLLGLSGELLRRKQGRQDWEPPLLKTNEVHYKYPDVLPPPSQHHPEMSAVTEHIPTDGPAGETDWDIERAVEQRLVQVVFTVPRERLRVVNGDEGSIDEEPRVADMLAGEVSSESDRDEALAARSPFTPSPPPSTPPPLEMVPNSPELPMTPPPLRLSPPKPLNVPAHRFSTGDDDLLGADADDGRTSRSTMASSGRPSPLPLLTAETMTVERPLGRTKVLRMVDSIEKSADTSREGSPARSSQSPASSLTGSPERGRGTTGRVGLWS